MKTLRIIDADDWVAVVYDGKVLEQNHSLAPFHWAEILRELGINVTKINVEPNYDDDDDDSVQDAIDKAIRDSKNESV